MLKMFSGCVHELKQPIKKPEKPTRLNWVGSHGGCNQGSGVWIGGKASGVTSLRTLAQSRVTKSSINPSRC
jgi:hypothetical protein